MPDFQPLGTKIVHHFKINHINHIKLVYSSTICLVFSCNLQLAEIRVFKYVLHDFYKTIRVTSSIDLISDFKMNEDTTSELYISSLMSLVELCLALKIIYHPFLCSVFIFFFICQSCISINIFGETTVR